jgi:hypothetical protein
MALAGVFSMLALAFLGLLFYGWARDWDANVVLIVTVVADSVAAVALGLSISLLLTHLSRTKRARRYSQRRQVFYSPTAEGVRAASEWLSAESRTASRANREMPTGA